MNTPRASLSAAARLLSIEAAMAARAVADSADPAGLIGSVEAYDESRQAARSALRAAWRGDRLAGRPPMAHAAAAAFLLLPPRLAAAVAAEEAADLAAAVTAGAVAEVARTSGDTARAYVADASRLGLPPGGIVVIGAAVGAASAIEPARLRRRIEAMARLGARAVAEAGASPRLDPAARAAISGHPARLLLVVATPEIAPLGLSPRSLRGVDGLLLLDAFGATEHPHFAAAAAERTARRLAACAGAMGVDLGPDPLGATL